MIDPQQLGLTVRLSPGIWVSCVCPFHDDHAPSATFNTNTGALFCFRESKFFSLEEIVKITHGEVVQVANNSQIAWDHDQDVSEWKPLLLAPLAIDHAYAESRGISREVIRKYGIRVTPTFLVFPLYDLLGQIIGVQIRLFEKNPYAKYMILGQRPMLWPAFELVTAKKEIILVEGVIGAIRLRQFGYEAFSLLGSRVNQRLLNMLNGRRPIVFLDQDLAGIKAAYKLGLSGFKVVFPGGETDELTESELKSRIKSASYDLRKLETYLTLSGEENAIKAMKKRIYSH